ncbi:MAG TPA: hypothetical protein VM531_11340 [Sphingomicrobium sp.]|nr:hypothetical protein [Sphingomicrobium sp.]
MRKRQIAPRLTSGEICVGIGHGLPPDVKDGLRLIARHENKSVSWVLEQVIIEYFHLPKPKYRLARGQTKKGSLLQFGRRRAG